MPVCIQAFCSANLAPNASVSFSLISARMGKAVVPALARRLAVPADSEQASSLLWLLLHGSEGSSPVAPSALAPAVPGLTDLALGESAAARQSGATCLTELAKRCAESHVRGMAVVLRKAQAKLAADNRPEPREAATNLAQALESLDAR